MVTLNYYHPNKYNQIFLAIDWLSRQFFKLVSVDNIYSILFRILLEQSFLFISDNIQDLTTLVLGFSYLIAPFKWPFIIIPNLPLDLIGMTESPVPYLMGVLGISTFKQSFIDSDIPANIVIHSGGSLQTVFKDDVPLPNLKNLKHIIQVNRDMAIYYLKMKNNEEYFNYCEKIYKNIYEIIKSNLADPIEKLFKENVNVKFNFYTLD
jgi:hypothetical protein